MMVSYIINHQLILKYIKGKYDKQGEKIYQGKCTSEEHEKILKDVLKNGTYYDCIAWYNGFHKAMLDIDLKNLEIAFTALKKEAEKGK